MDTQSNLILPGSQALKLAKHEKFCQVWVSLESKVGRGRNSAISAGYSPSGASVEAVRLRARTDIANRIAFLTGQKLQKQDLGMEDFSRTIKEHLDFSVKKLIYANGDLIPLEQLPDDVARCIVSLIVTEKILKTEDSVQTIERVSKYTLEGKSRYNEQLGRYIDVITDIDDGKTLNKVLQKADEMGEELYNKAIQNLEKGITFDHSAEIDQQDDNNNF